MPTNCGERPLNVTWAGTPPMLTVGCTRVTRLASSEFAPLVIVGLTAPRPVARMMSPPGSPILAGRVERPGAAPAGAARLLSGLIAIPWPPRFQMAEIGRAAG